MSVGELTPFDFPEDWDVVTIAGVRSPGLAKVSGWSRDLNYDVKVGRGTAGATITLAGKPPSKGSIEFQCWTTAQMQRWNDEILPLLKFVPHPTGAVTPKVNTPQGDNFQLGNQGGGTSSGTINEPGTSTTPTKGDPSAAYQAPTQPKALTKADALDIYHPALADIEVTSVLPPEKLGIWEHQGGLLFTRKIDFIEFVQAGANIVATPNASTGAPQGDNYAIGAAQANPNPNQASNAAGSAKDAQGATVPKGFGGNSP